MIRRLRVFPWEECLVAQAVPGFLLAVGWAVMYEVYHEEGAYYVSLLQEILDAEGLFPYFLLSALLMALPLGMVLDGLRHALEAAWLRPARAASWPPPGGAAPQGLADGYLLYRHLRATTLVPARAAANLALVLLVFTLWFSLRMYRISGWQVYTPAFLVGTPLVGLGLAAALLVQYRQGLRVFQAALAPPDPPPAPPAAPAPPEA